MRIKLENLDQVQRQLQNLTNNEDEKQELLVKYLEGESISQITETYKENQKNKDLEQKIADFAHYLYSCSSTRLRELLLSFEPMERQVIAMLALGCKINEISVYNSLSVVRLQQMIDYIKTSSKWEELYGVKKTTER